MNTNPQSKKTSYPKDILKKKLDDPGAKSAVTGGHPEDMNGMPADLNPNDEASVYDGSDLKAPNKIRKHNN